MLTSSDRCQASDSLILPSRCEGRSRAEATGPGSGETDRPSDPIEARPSGRGVPVRALYRYRSLRPALRASWRRAHKRGLPSTLRSLMNSTWRASWRSQSGSCPAPPISGCKRSSTSVSGSNSCSSRRDSRLTASGLLEPLQPHRPSAIAERFWSAMKGGGPDLPQMEPAGGPAPPDSALRERSITLMRTWVGWSEKAEPVSDRNELT